MEELMELIPENCQEEDDFQRIGNNRGFCSSKQVF